MTDGVLTISVLGGLAVACEGRSVALPQSRKTRALLAYLAVVERPQRRDRLCELLWDVPDDPRGALRWSLSKLRPILNGASRERLRADRETVWLARDGIDVDYARLARLTPGRLDSTELPDLERAAAAFRGGFLEDLAMPRCPAFEAWRVAHADALELTRLAVLRALVDRLSDQPDRALPHAHQLCALDPEDSAAAAAVQRLSERVRDAGRRAVCPPAAADSRPPAKAATEATTEATFEQPGPEPVLPPASPDIGPKSGPAPDTVRRYVAVLAVDLVSPLLALDELDPELGVEAVEPILERMAETAEVCGGHCLTRGQSDMVAVFGAAGASEDYTVQACRAALAVKRLVDESGDGGLRVRIAVDAGDAVIRPGPSGMPGTVPALRVTGPAVKAAPEIAQALRRDAVAISPRALRLAGGYVATRPLAPEELDRGSRRRALHELLGETAALSRWFVRAQPALTPLVGRGFELQLLRHAWHQARAGQGRVVALVAEAGVGKSRLAHELLASPDLEPVRVLECGALEIDSGVSLALIKKLLLAALELPADAPDDAVAAGLDGALRHLTLPAELRPGLATGLDLPGPPGAGDPALPRGLLRSLSDGVAALLAASARRTPLVLLIEDLHWCDDASNAVLAGVLDRVPGLPVLVLCTYRPSYAPAWSAGDAFVQVALAPLAPTDAAELARQLLGADAQDPRAVEALVALTDGVPLFIEETVRAFTGDGGPGATGAALAGGAGTGAADVPASIQAVIVASLHRLDATSRRVLQVASVIGRVVPDELLRAAARLDDDVLATALDRLRRSGLLLETGFPPKREFSFKHAMVARAAYGTLGRADRAELHRRVLDRLAARGESEVPVELLARHAAAAEDWDRAGRLFLPAARRALQRSAHTLALAHVRDGLGALAQWPAEAERQRLELEYCKVEGVAWMSARGWGAPEVFRAFDRAEALANRLGSDRELFEVLRGKGQYCMIGGRPTQAQALAERCEALLPPDPEPGLQIETAHLHWTNGLFLGDYARVVEHGDRAAALYDPDRHHTLTFRYSGHDPGVCCRIFRSLALVQQGDPAAADRLAQDGLELAGRLEHPLTTAVAYWGHAYHGLLRDDPELARAWSEQAMSLCRAHDLPFMRAQGEVQQGWALARLGDRRDGLRLMEIGIAGIRASGAEMGLPYLLALLAEVHAVDGRMREAATLVEEAQQAVARNGARFQLSEILRIKALLAGHARDRAGTEQLLHQALEVARSQGATLPEFRAAADLARCLRDGGRRSEARDLLAPYATRLDQLGDLPVARTTAALL
jgi:DNA-binding SARP family transcriptional activator/predicted ATPase